MNESKPRDQCGVFPVNCHLPTVLRAVSTGFEPAISALTGQRVKPGYTTRPFVPQEAASRSSIPHEFNVGQATLSNTLIFDSDLSGIKISKR